MKKTALTLALFGLLAGNASATVLEFDETTVSGTGGTVVMNGLDFATEISSVTQTDTDGSTDITGGDAFVELGGTIAVNWELDGSIVGGTELDATYEIWITYELSGVALGAPDPLGFSDLLVGVDFDPFSSFGALYIDTNVDGVFDGAGDADVDVLGTFDMGRGDCAVLADIAGDGTMVVNTGGCDVTFDFMATAGYFSHGANDLSTLDPVMFNFDVTVEEFNGLYFSYLAQEAAVGDGDVTVQNFTIEHDGNLAWVVPEPGSIAMLSLGLLALGAGRRRS